MKKILYVCALAAVALPSVSHGWGPEASEMIARSALHAVRREFGDALMGNEQALVEGCTQPIDVILDEYVRAGGTADPVLAVGREINLLKDVARLHFTEYGAFRFGVVGRIAAEIVMPFGFPADDTERAVKQALENDIEQMVDRLRYQYEQRRTVDSPSIYFAERTRFLEIGRQRIAADYKGGTGYGGYARRAVPEYYKHAVSAMADVWFTILKDVRIKVVSKRQVIPRPPEQMKFYASQELLVDYFTDEVVYFVGKGNKRTLAEESYLFFTMFNKNPERPKPYERIGDALLAAGDGTRAVTEYRKGWSLDPTWHEIRDKIVRYYLTLGQRHLDAGEKVQNVDGQTYDPLEEALAAYNELLEVDPANPLGNQKRNAVKLAIEARRVRRKRMEELVETGRAVARAAAELEHEAKYAQAITQYKNAIALFNSVTDEFDDVHSEADAGASAALGAIDTIFQTAIDNADALIQQAQARELEGNWQGAIQAYRGVPQTLQLFDNKQFEPEYPDYYRDAERILQTAQTKEQQAQTAYEQQQAAQQG